MNTSAPGSVPNHLVWAIVSTVLASCLCCPFGLLGIIAIVQANKVNTLLNQGDLDGARRASDTAKTWCWVATALAGIGLVWVMFSLITGGLGSYMEMARQMQGG